MSRVQWHACAPPEAIASPSPEADASASVFFGGSSGDEGGTLRAPEVNMIQSSEIKPHAPVVCSNGGQFAVVDHMQGTDSIKLARDDKGQHHLIPLAWVTKVDNAVHVDRPGDQAMREWVPTA